MLVLTSSDSSAFAPRRATPAFARGSNAAPNPAPSPTHWRDETIATGAGEPSEAGSEPGRRPTRHAIAAAALCALAAAFVVPAGIESGSMLASADDPVVIADRALARSFDATVAGREIAAALAANDPDLAQSYLELAQDRGVAVDPQLAAKANAAIARAGSPTGQAESFARGFVTGEPDNMAGFAGTALGDLFVFGDIRDALREGARYAKGQPVDELILGLSLVGIAVTAGTYASLGAGAPARVGLSVAKAARRTGRLSAGLTESIGRSLRQVVDWSALKRAGASFAEPATAVRAAREAVKVERAGGLVRMAGDVGRIQSRAGARAALDGLRVAQSPREVARVARLAEKKGGKTRAILKTLGRSAILLSVASFNLAMWIFWALLTLLGFVAAAKSAVERATQRHLDRRKLKILRARQRELEGMSALS